MALGEAWRASVTAALSGAFGNGLEVQHQVDQSGLFSIEVVKAVDRPQTGATSYSTLGLSGHPVSRGGSELPVRVELVGACESAFPEFSNVLATAAFCIIKDRWFCAPGTMFPDVVRMYRPDAAMRHLLFVRPFLWGHRVPHVLQLEGKTSAWLQAIPISEAEMAYGEARGPEALDDVFFEKQIDVFDIDRDSVL
jgi:hypothetical protein